MRNHTELTLLSMQHNLDQIVASLRQGLANPDCVDDLRRSVEAAHDVAKAILATVEAALDDSHAY